MLRLIKIKAFLLEKRNNEENVIYKLTVLFGCVTVMALYVVLFVWLTVMAMFVVGRRRSSPEPAPCLGPGPCLRRACFT